MYGIKHIETPLYQLAFSPSLTIIASQQRDGKENAHSGEDGRSIINSLKHIQSRNTYVRRRLLIFILMKYSEEKHHEHGYIISVG